jgi:predicted permease
MGKFLGDIHYGVRKLRSNPGVTAIALFSLALGIGANTTVFSWIDSLLLNPVPGATKGSELVAFTVTTQSGGITALSYPDFLDLQTRNKVLSGLAAYDMSAFSINAYGKPERIWGQMVSGNFFDVLGVSAIRGRTFTPEEGLGTAPAPVVVISYAIWQSRFGGDASLVGKAITLNNLPFTVIGVAPSQFRGSYTGLAFDAWVPLNMQGQLRPDGARLSARDVGWLSAIGRLKPGIGAPVAESELNAIIVGIKHDYPETRKSIVGVVLYPLWKSPIGATAILSPVLSILMGLVALVLLISCSNVANLMLARVVTRRREMAIRGSLGASRWRLIRQLLSESVVLALLGGLLGAIIAYWTAQTLRAFVPSTGFPVYVQIRFGSLVFLFNFLVSLVAGIVFGLVPALQVSAGALMTSLKDESGGAGGTTHKSRLRNTLVIAQVALSCILLICAGLLMRSLSRGREINLGFNPKGVALASIDLSTGNYTKERGLRFYGQMIEQLQTLPQMESVSFAKSVPLGFGGSDRIHFTAEGYKPGPDERVGAFSNYVGPAYFRTMEIPLVKGREFTIQDNERAPKVAIVNEALAAKYWPQQDALGKHLQISDDWVAVAGVARNSHYWGLSEDPEPYVFLPALQFYAPGVTLHARSSLLPGATLDLIRTRLHLVDPTLAVFNETTLQSHIATATLPQRMASVLLAIFGLIAIVLAAMGIYGIVSYTVVQRTHEIGIRLALGATPASVLTLIVRQGILLIIIGVVVGLAGAVAVGRLLSGLLLGVSPTDAVTLTEVAALLFVVALVACFIPALRAAKVRPSLALRHE